MEGLRFECVPGCTNCCRVQGWIYLSETDATRIAGYLKLSPAEFESRYLYRTKNTLRFRKPKGAQCHFLNDGGCSIHAVKPTQCRLFPFWPELVENRKNWNQTAKNCPGIGRGPLIQIGQAIEIADEMRRSYPSDY